MSGWVGVDLGTSSVKIARFVDGQQRDTSVFPVLAPQRVGASVTQAVSAYTSSLPVLLSMLHPGDRIALTGQRDTIAFGDTLMSWQDERAAVFGTLWDHPDLVPGPVDTLISAVCRAWTGERAESTSGLPAALGPSQAERRKFWGFVDLPRLVEVGAAVGRLGDHPVHLCGGDKNCELLGLGVDGGRAGLSMGTAFSLGVRSLSDPIAGTYRSLGSLAGRWDVEVGLPIGGSARSAPWMDDQTDDDGDDDDDLFVVPTFGASMDGPSPGRIVGLRPSTDRRALARAWRRGVAAELAQLLPRAEAAAAEPITVIAACGGAVDARWTRLLANALARPVEHVEDRFVGCRGAVIAATSNIGEPSPARRRGTPTLPEPVASARFAAWALRWRAERGA